MIASGLKSAYQVSFLPLSVFETWGPVQSRAGRNGFGHNLTSGPSTGQQDAVSARRYIPVIGLIGGIGSGKSAIARWLARRGDVSVIDADALGHQALTLPHVKQQLRDRFGESIFDAGGQIDRAALARAVFGRTPSHRQALRDLEAIVHPEIGRRMRDLVDQVRSKGEVEAILVDAAVLLEAGWDDVCDALVFVDAPREVREQRVAASRGWSPEELRQRESCQWPLEKKRSAADHVIVNAGTDVGHAAQHVKHVLTRLARERT
ncbi:MAG TPA: dephospho-CoA kinase [Planctomycetaceae bacterium]|nr:dephospho-CoA kinase [Planctomycetaceae bacterium]